LGGKPFLPEQAKEAVIDAIRPIVDEHTEPSLEDTAGAIVKQAACEQSVDEMLSGLRRLPPPPTPLAQEPPSEQQVTYTPTRRARSRARQDHAGGYREDCKPDTSAAD
jgi:hypothetical protein